MLVKIVISAAYGILLGLVTIPLSKKLTLSRTDDPGMAAPLNKTSFKLLAVVLGLIAAAGIVFTSESYSLMIRDLLLLIPIFSIAFVDSLVRKIPNPLLLAMLAIDFVSLIYEAVQLNDPDEVIDFIFKPIIGVTIGMIVCIIPSILKIPMGAGDIKYSGVIGFTVYAFGYFQAMVLMAVLVALFWAYLKATKKGSIKTQVPMGPFLSIGTVITMCLPITRFVGEISLF